MLASTNDYPDFAPLPAVKCRDHNARTRVLTVSLTELQAAMSGTAGGDEDRRLTLNKSQRTKLEAALVRFGARRSGRSLLDKEKALMKLIAEATG
jgi:hypothetical protein